MRVRRELAEQGDPGFPEDAVSLFSKEAMLPMLAVTRALLVLLPPHAQCIFQNHFQLPGAGEIRATWVLGWFLEAAGCVGTAQPGAKM